MAQGYQVIARRWRPRQFSELVGQEHIVRTLSNAIQSQRIAHAYLFVGPRGTGKTTTARIFAKALNCEGGPKVDPDDSSPICQAIMNGSCMDVIEVDGASNNSVEQIRNLREDCQYSPAQAQYKIYIIDEVHMLTSQAFNALLKTLEEPPAHVKFIFATTESHKVLPTIVSRCQRFEFRPIPETLIADRLEQIARAEGIDVEKEALLAVARMAAGGMRDAQSILDQMISFCGTKIGLRDVLDVYGMADPAQLRELAAGMVRADYPAILAAIAGFVDEGRDLLRVLTDLQDVMRKALLDAVASGGSTQLLGVTAQRENLLRMLDVLHAGEDRLRLGLSERVNLEVLLLKAVDRGRTRAIDALIQQITELSAGLPPSAGEKKIGTSLPAPAREDTVAAAPVLPSEETAMPSTPAEAVGLLPETTLRILRDRLSAEVVGVQPFRAEDWIR